MDGRIEPFRRRRSSEMGCVDRDQMAGFVEDTGPGPRPVLSRLVVVDFVLKIYQRRDTADLRPG